MNVELSFVLVAEVSLEHSLYSVEEIDHHVDICTIVTMGNISFESPVFITTIGVSALGKIEGTHMHFTNYQTLSITTQIQKITLILVKGC